MTGLWAMDNKLSRYEYGAQYDQGYRAGFIKGVKVIKRHNSILQKLDDSYASLAIIIFLMGVLVGVLADYYY